MNEDSDFLCDYQLITKSYYSPNPFLPTDMLSCSVASDSLQPHRLQPARLLFPWGFSRKEYHALPQGIFPTQGLNPGLPYCRQILYQLSHQGSPRILEWVTDLFSRGSSWPRNQTRISCIADGFFTSWTTIEMLFLLYVLDNILLSLICIFF